MTIFFYNGLTRNPEIGNTPVWILPNIQRLGQVRDTKFGMNISHKILLKAAKCPGYSFYSFWVMKRKPTGRGEGQNYPPPPPTHPPTQIRVNESINPLEQKVIKVRQTVLYWPNIYMPNMYTPNMIFRTSVTCKSVASENSIHPQDC